MIVDRSDLDEALERAAELDAALRRHPHDEGLRQRLRTVVALVRRLARALEHGALAFLVALVLSMVACTVPQPLNIEVPPPDGAEDAAAIVVQEWSDRLGAELDVEDLPPVRWFEGGCLDYGDRCRADGGYAFSPWAAPEFHLIVHPTIHESALAHELLHWALDEVGGDGDGDHRHRAWGQVGDVCGILAEAGL